MRIQVLILKFKGLIIFSFRQGSGSACRSMYGGFVAWEKGEKKDGSDSIAKQVTNNRVFSLDVTAAILVSQNNKTAAMLESQTNPAGVELFFFLCKRFLLFQKICIDVGHVSENTLLSSK